MEYYIYMYLDLGDVPFYVGKGKGARFYSRLHLHGPNKFLANKIRKVGVDNIKIHFLHRNLTEEEAFQFEIFYIELYGRRDLGTGTLCNLTNGGEGSSGLVHSDETRRKIGRSNKSKIRTDAMKLHQSEIHKGKPIPVITGENHPMYGKHYSEEALCKRRGKYKYRNNAIKYLRKNSTSLKSLANITGLSRQQISCICVS